MQQYRSAAIVCENIWHRGSGLITHELDEVAAHNLLGASRTYRYDVDGRASDSNSSHQGERSLPQIVSELSAPVC